VAAKQTSLPDVVLEVFNELIAQNFSNGSAIVKQSDVVELLVKRGLKENEIFEKQWLDVEEIYRSAGWIVKYDKPGWDENYGAFFEFRTKSKS
jgi:lipopolysaccharide biosynthesis protein